MPRPSRAARAAAAVLALAGCAPLACALPFEEPRACVAFHDCYDPSDPCAIHACELTASGDRTCRKTGYDNDCSSAMNGDEPATENTNTMTIRSLTTTLPLLCGLTLAACCCDHDGTPLPEVPTDKPDAGEGAGGGGAASSSTSSSSSSGGAGGGSGGQGGAGGETNGCYGPGPSWFDVPGKPCSIDADCVDQFPCSQNKCVLEFNGDKKCRVTETPGAFCGEGMVCVADSPDGDGPACCPVMP